MNRLQRYVTQCYINFQLEDTGFKFGRTGRNKQIEILEAFGSNSLQDLENFIGRSNMVIIPNLFLNKTR